MNGRRGFLGAVAALAVAPWERLRAVVRPVPTFRYECKTVTISAGLLRDSEIDLVALLNRAPVRDPWPDLWSDD